ncbi:DUF3841 domain-containing protein [Cytobacillus horneckiae]|uniref:DUF3841 domain-containing protein n=1 Tax=Cytobacillus horneckiae TaxID=549687 RepID=A0A2N0ZJB9_9BACI|nr:DUF3841 domain-containing protein [Cytobacillus horneckiae]MCM3180645.1 DUF3841 domain-containing protein [Cytobacillus horneckiae]MEC1153980.1 DUF3841 domain-containing protein [Cytobacillus horneckiae]MED2938555.1 DUF3841 domain-containing protein [Cytobacillus horneckiae]PKG29607.1 DUF3841 domain-containing protein [Cytobacillus horneckiae]
MGIFWTIQSAAKWEEVKKIGYLIGVHEQIWPEFVEPYLWMMEQMKSKIKNYDQAEYPVWVWTNRPDLRRSGHLNKGESGVLLKIDIDDDRILLSDFQAWHFVLDGVYCNIEAKEENELNLSSKSIKESWKKIFDLNDLANNPDWGECIIQGVAGKILLHEITFAKEFTAR